MRDIVKKFKLNLGSEPTFTPPFGRRGLRSVGLQLQSSTGQVSACQLPRAMGIPPPPAPLLFAFISCSTDSSKPSALPHSDLGAAPSPQGQVRAASTSGVLGSPRKSKPRLACQVRAPSANCAQAPGSTSPPGFVTLHLILSKQESCRKSELRYSTAQQCPCEPRFSPRHCQNKGQKLCTLQSCACISYTASFMLAGFL